MLLEIEDDGEGLHEDAAEHPDVLHRVKALRCDHDRDLLRRHRALGNALGLTPMPPCTSLLRGRLLMVLLLLKASLRLRLLRWLVRDQEGWDGRVGHALSRSTRLARCEESGQQGEGVDDDLHFRALLDQQEAQLATVYGRHPLEELLWAHGELLAPQDDGQGHLSRLHCSCVQRRRAVADDQVASRLVDATALLEVVLREEGHHQGFVVLPRRQDVSSGGVQEEPARSGGNAVGLEAS
mmetsp:Transcript_98975/g.317372  ORF Transcript_98975/g.317372 Transcript_98975/m.317372 type:complete len:239 (-) Transcript_98975:852-1568(-)